MINSCFRLFAFFLVSLLVGCACVQEPFKTAWGSSTRALEQARVTAEKKDFRCEPGQCFSAVVKFVEAQPEKVVATPAKPQERVSVVTDEERANALTTPMTSLHIFQRDARRYSLVLMGVPGAIDTTEVGVFFTRSGEGVTTIEVSSLNRHARIRAAGILFEEVEKSFPLAKVAPVTSAPDEAAPATTVPDTVAPATNALLEAAPAAAAPVETKIP